MVKYVYTLGASGERVKVEEIDRTVEYTYDELYRLTSETITKGKKLTTYTYAYDNVSNRTLKTVNGVETVYTYNSLNQLISENDTTYEYDLNGNLVRVIGTGKATLYEYNSENRLVKATVQQGNNVVVETYTYDYAGNRTSKTTTANKYVEKVYYLNDNSSLTNVLVEFGANGDEICYYTIGADLVSQEVNGKVFTYLYDGHGTVRALADEDGKITDTYSYDAFGNLISSTGSTANSYLYCGEQFDSTTGLYYLRARYMDTNTGRFISQDTYAGSTADPISLHKYLYASSNPVMNWDPSGYADSLAGVMTCVSAIDIMVGMSITASCLGIGIKLINSFYDLMFDITLKNAVIEIQLTSITDTNYAVEELDRKLGKTMSQLQAIVDSKIGNEPGPYIVYCLKDTDGYIRYVGRTKNLTARLEAHRNSNSKNSKLTYAGSVEKLNYKQARALEQTLMIYYHTRNWLKENGNNSINGIGKNNKNKDIYFGELKNLFDSEYVQNQLDNELLNLKENIGLWW